MKLYLKPIIIVLLIFFSCKDNIDKKTETISETTSNKRIDLLKNELQIKINSDVRVLKNELESKELFLPDHTLNITIGLTKNQTKNISNQITDTPYYNELEFYRWKEGSRNLLDNGKYSFQTIQDSIANTKYRGSWIKTEFGYEFVDFGKSNDAVFARINTKQNTLKFEFIDM